jgi:hypothetical protein
MFEGLDSNIYEDIELSRGEIFDLVDDFSRQVAYYDKQSAWRLLVRRATWNFYKDEPEGDYNTIHNALMEMYTTGFILENTNSNPDSAQQLKEELSDCINNHLQVISDYQTWKMTDDFPPIFEADWRAALSSEQYFEMASRRLSPPVRFSTHFMELLDLYPEVHLFEIYRTVYYQWHGNKLLKEASDRATSTLPRQKQWKLILKQMVNHDVVDRYKLEEMYPDIMKTISEIVFDELTQKYINRKNLNEDL